MIRACLTLAAVLIAAAPQEGARIDDLVEALASSDNIIRKSAVVELKAIGAPALPAIERKIREAGGAGYFDLYKDILAATSSKDDPPARNARIEPLPPDMEPPAPPAGNRREEYVHAKLCDGLKLYRRKSYGDAKTIATALLALEPHSMYKEQLRSLDALCGQELFKSAFFRTAIVPDKEIYEIGESVELTFRVENTSDNAITITFPGKWTMIVREEACGINPIGPTTGVQGANVFEFDREIAILSGASWEKKYLHDSSQEGIDPSIFRTLTVSTTPGNIVLQTKEGAVEGHLAFDPLTVKIVPKGYREKNNDPLAALTDAIDHGTHNDVFMAAVMLNRDQERAGIDMLVSILKIKGSGSGAIIVMRALGCLTGKDFGTQAQKWVKWWDETRDERKDGAK